MKTLASLTLRPGVAIATLVLATTVASAQVPQTMSFQGELGLSVAANSTQSMTFSIYAAATGGTALWTESQTVTLQRRTFSVILGINTALDIPFDQQYWLGMTVGNGSELSPRVQLTSSPHALNSDKIGGRAVSSSEPEVGDMLAWDGVAWVPTAPAQDDAVPTGFMILGSTPTAPDGYTYTGSMLKPEDPWLENSNDGFSASSHAAAAVVNGKIYLLGGIDASGAMSRNEEYDPSTNSWTTRSSTGLTARTYYEAGVVNGKIYALGGWDNGTALNVNEEYDPATDSWATRSSTGFTARSSHDVVVIDDKIYAIGGADNGVLNTNEMYDPATDTWTTKSSAGFTPRHDLEAAVVDGTIYAIGGYDGAPLNVHEAYDPSTDSWTARASSPTSRSDFAAVVVDDRIHGLCGYDGGPINTHEVYDPTTDSWSTVISDGLPASYGPAAEVVDGTIYLFGGWNGTFMDISLEFDPATPYDPSLRYYVHVKQ